MDRSIYLSFGKGVLTGWVIFIIIILMAVRNLT